MTTNRAEVTDSVVVEVNGEQTADAPGVKGPDPDRLKGHSAEARAFDARLRKENGPTR